MTNFHVEISVSVLGTLLLLLLMAFPLYPLSLHHMETFDKVKQFIFVSIFMSGKLPLVARQHFSWNSLTKTVGLWSEVVSCNTSFPRDSMNGLELILDKSLLLFLWETQRQGAAGVLQAGLVPCLVLKLKTELDEIVELILATLSNCLRMEVSEALATGAVAALKEKLTHPSAAIRSKAARVLLDISSHAEGKTAVCEEEVIPVLVSLLEDTDPEVQASATGALMFAMVTPQGRCSAMAAGAMAPLLALVAERSSPARLNAVKALTLLAELPEGRAALLEHTDTVRSCLRDSRRVLRAAARTAITAIEWKPFCERDLF